MVLNKQNRQGIRTGRNGADVLGGRNLSRIVGVTAGGAVAGVR